MNPVLPGFSGHVPDGLAAIFPNSKFTQSPIWNGFKAPYCCVNLLDASDPLFQRIGKRYIELQTELYSLPENCVSSRFYNADTFNELDPESSSPDYLTQSSTAVFDSMLAGDSKAVWVMQGWMFFYSSFWTDKTIPPYLSGVPDDRLIILDLYSDASSTWKKTNFYYGKYFIWCMLHNFGGNLGLYGRLPFISTDPISALEADGSTMIGTGMTPEGINQNFIVYDLMSEMSWRRVAPDLDSWVRSFVARRYGIKDVDSSELTPVFAAWKVLQDRVYDCNTPASMGIPKSLIVLRPTLPSRVRRYFMPTVPCHNTSDLILVLEMFLEAPPILQGQKQFRYDIVDVTRQILSDLFIPAQENFGNSFYAKTGLEVLRRNGRWVLDIIKAMEKVLATHEGFLLGNWIEAAKASTNHSATSLIFQFNARNQLTLWGPDGQISDYASKQWSGLVGTYYLPRWKLFVEEVEKAYRSGTNFDQQKYRQLVLETVEKPWQYSQDKFPTVAHGDSFSECSEVFKKFIRPKAIVFSSE
eukprot:TRINITY_DN2529_c0_g1_i1.p1 TRINITY_DN2529_c0_g1~~TRINITY_DN2529_c0_g1_i1.p1  ORF type:complete len:618 (-),score=137.25 TRINITY_DN2529_c0_g1_i1:562-2142(-)